MKYAICADIDVAKLVERVNQAIKEGWEPQGGLVVQGSDWFGQAMTLRVLQNDQDHAASQNPQKQEKVNGKTR